ncbi:MAG: hypothetical protein ABNH00_03820 [Dokdonia sp.]|jgi:hypothetical protein|nr:hypothetical protein [Cytophagaceae bacterium]|tara:strand:+ start:747 stop:1043 length:297 start_codon:yes stop_codon:yes gene_type:complete
MALQINTIDKVICLKGKVGSEHLLELTNYFKALLKFEDTLTINLCELREGKESLEIILNELQGQLPEEKQLIYYGFTEARVQQLFMAIENEANFYQAA